MILKAIKWAYGDSLKYIGFIFALGAIVILGMTFIAFPLQTILTVVGLFVVYVLFTFFEEL